MLAVGAAVVLAVLQRQPACWADRAVPAETKLEQLATIAEAIAVSSETVEREAELVDVGWHESRWCLAVGSGKKRGGRGEGYWQLEGSHHGAGARSGLSLEATSSAARLASEQLDRSRQCGSSPAARFTAYAGRPCWQSEAWISPPEDSPRHCTVGGDCVRHEGWPTLDSRVRGYWWAVSALRRGLPP